MIQRSKDQMIQRSRDPNIIEKKPYTILIELLA